MAIKQIIAIREDLEMSRGKIASQAAHASMKSLVDAMEKRNDMNTIEWSLNLNSDLELKEWLEGSFTKIVVAVKDEREMDKLYNKCKEAGLRVSMIIDNGTTEFDGQKTKTCVAIGPHEADKLDPFTKRYRLLK